jgi:hypothetical protein
VISGKIDAGMRSGIPEELWKIVVKVYNDAEKLIELTGNERPLSGRVIVLDKDGKVVYFHDRGFSVAALDELANHFPSSQPQECDQQERAYESCHCRCFWIYRTAPDTTSS